MPRFFFPTPLRASVLLSLSLSILASAPHQLRAQVARLYPVDEAARDPSFLAFRSRLIQALQERDEMFLLGVLAPDIKSSFGGDAGVEDFKSFWELDQPDTAVWKTLLTVLSLGGSFQGDNYFIAPYTNSEFPSSLDAFEHGVILGEHVEARKEPGEDGAILAVLSSDIVRVSDWTPLIDPRDQREWIAVELAGGIRAFVLREQLRSPIDYRAFFEKKNDKWLLTIFVAGD